MLKEIMKDQIKLKSVLVTAAYLLLMVLAAVLFNTYVDQDNLRTTVASAGLFGPVIFFLLETIYVTFTPLLNTAIYITSGYLFGGVGGFVINFLATVCGLFLIVFLVKKFGRPLLKRFISKSFYDRFDIITQKVGPVLLLVVYVFPFTPDDELTYVLAASSISMKRFILPILLGTLAKSTLSYIGSDGTAGLAITGYARLITLVVGLIAVGIQEYIYKNTQQSFSKFDSH